MCVLSGSVGPVLSTVSTMGHCAPCATAHVREVRRWVRAVWLMTSYPAKLSDLVIRITDFYF